MMVALLDSRSNIGRDQPLGSNAERRIDTKGGFELDFARGDIEPPFL
jgi:hypothetical protein